MAAHTTYPPTGDPMVRGDPAAWVFRFRIEGTDEDITGWTWRTYVRSRIDGEFIHECQTFETHTPASLPDLFPGDPSVVPCVLILRWAPAETAVWASGQVADIEQLTPTKRTWVIIDSLRVDKDVSNEPGDP